MVVGRDDGKADRWWRRPYVLPDAEHLAFLVPLGQDVALCEWLRPFREALRASDDLELVPEPALHLLVHGVGPAPAADASTVRALVVAAEDLLARVSPVQARVVGPRVLQNGVAVDLAPVAGLAAIRTAVRSAIDVVLGGVRYSDGGPWPCVLLADAVARVPDHAVVESLVQVVPAPAPIVLIDAVELVRMGREGAGTVWTTVARLAVGGGR
ncbi:MAG: 2'-5' RNA ligase family protein [Cellulomonadaceae bacterium]|nr:2'-5' RNA ligase family protein [Cellulomonadaceae bacterium]